MQTLLLGQFLLALPLTASLSTTNISNQHVLQCLSTHHEAEQRLSTFSSEQKFDFVYTMLETYGSREQAVAFYSMRDDFIADSSTINHYTHKVLMTWTSSCVADPPQTAANRRAKDAHPADSSR